MVADWDGAWLQHRLPRQIPLCAHPHGPCQVLTTLGTSCGASRAGAISSVGLGGKSAACRSCLRISRGHIPESKGTT